MSRPRLLDLFCGAGGSAMGYHRAGFDVTGVDNRPQKRYPFRFICADALDYLEQHGGEFDVIHASPPCQRFSVATQVNGPGARDKHPDLIEPIRERLLESAKIFIIENVPRSPVRGDIVLCGTFFGLKVYRHRKFESNVFLMQPPHTPHQDRCMGMGRGLSPKGFVSVTGRGGLGAPPESYRPFVSVAGHISSTDYCRFAMGIDWMSRDELSQAIPPAYTEFIGSQLLEALT